MILDKEFFTLGVDPLKCVGAISIHVAVAIRCTSVAHQDSDLMESLRGVRPEIEGHVGVLDALSRMSLLAMDKVGELDWVLDEEDRGVVTDHIVVAFFGIVLDCETTRVTIAVISSTLSSNGGETQEDGGALANSVHKGSFAETGHIVLNLNVTVSTGSLSVDSSLGNSLTSEMGQFVKEVEVLGEDGAIGTSSH